MFVLAQLSRWELHGTVVSFLSSSQNSAAGKPLLTANSTAQMLAVRLIAKGKSETTKTLGFFD